MGKRKGLFIAFEGVHGASKTTQVQRLAHYLDVEKEYAVIKTYEVGGTPFANEIRRLIDDYRYHRMAVEDPHIMLALVLLARRSHVKEKIEPSLSQGKVVITDRYEGSTLVLQHYCGGVPQEIVRSLNYVITGGRSPDLTIVLDLDVEKALGRKAKEAWLSDEWKLWERNTERNRKARLGFLEFAKTEPGWKVVLTQDEIGRGRTADEIAEEVRGLVNPLLNKRKLLTKAELTQISESYQYPLNLVENNLGE